MAANVRRGECPVIRHNDPHAPIEAAITSELDEVAAAHPACLWTSLTRCLRCGGVHTVDLQRSSHGPAISAISSGSQPEMGGVGAIAVPVLVVSGDSGGIDLQAVDLGGRKMSAPRADFSTL